MCAHPGWACREDYTPPRPFTISEAGLTGWLGEGQEPGFFTQRPGNDARCFRAGFDVAIFDHLGPFMRAADPAGQCADHFQRIWCPNTHAAVLYVFDIAIFLPS